MGVLRRRDFDAEMHLDVLKTAAQVAIDVVD
jgi:hypothetical protein